MKNMLCAMKRDFNLIYHFSDWYFVVIVLFYVIVWFVLCDVTHGRSNMLPQLADRHSSCTLSQFEKYLLLTELRGEGLPKNRASILREMRNVSGRRKTHNSDRLSHSSWRRTLKGSYGGGQLMWHFEGENILFRSEQKQKHVNIMFLTLELVVWM